MLKETLLSPKELELARRHAEAHRFDPVSAAVSPPSTEELARYEHEWCIESLARALKDCERYYRRVHSEQL